MKFLSILFASAILFLAIKPGVDMISLNTDTEMSCCGNKCEAEETETDEHNHCSENGCNPFQSCCTNVLFIKQINSSVQLSELNISKEINFFYNSIFQSQFENDFWQPPKLV